MTPQERVRYRQCLVVRGEEFLHAVRTHSVPGGNCPPMAVTLWGSLHLMVCWPSLGWDWYDGAGCSWLLN